MQRLEQQLTFIFEIDKLKSVQRMVKLCDGSRLENSAEHSWHIAIMAMVLREYAPQPINLERVVTMLLLHDLVEIDTGDTFCYDQAGYEDKFEREQATADRLFGMLPEPQACEFRAYWDEFEACQTAEALFANTLDRLEPIFHNYFNDGGSWAEHGIKRSQVLERIALTEHIPELWDYAVTLLDDAVQKGFLNPDQ